MLTAAPVMQRSTGRSNSKKKGNSMNERDVERVKAAATHLVNSVEAVLAILDALTKDSTDPHVKRLLSHARGQLSKAASSAR